MRTAPMEEYWMMSICKRAEVVRLPRRLRRMVMACWVLAIIPMFAETPGAMLPAQERGSADTVYRLAPMDVRGRAPRGAPVRSDLLPLPAGAPFLPSLRLQAQGGAFAQVDLSIRGSSFSGAGLAIDGLALRNPQTEHFHAELPLPAALFDRMAVWTGLGNSMSGSGHLVGTLDLGLAEMATGGAVELGLSERGWNRQSVFGRRVVPVGDGLRLGVGAFGDREYAPSGFDYRDNRLERNLAGAQLQLGAGDARADFVVAHQAREFGARGFYGVPDTLAAVERTRDTLVLASGQWMRHDDVPPRRAVLAWRRFDDDYRLPDIGYHNAHRSTVVSGLLDGVEPLSPSWAVRWRLDGDAERLDSSNLGNHRRHRGGLLLLPMVEAGDFTVSAGAAGHVFSGDSPAVLPLAGVDWRPRGLPGTLFASYVERVRRPSFTELYYVSPANVGDPELERQRVQSWELGWRAESGAVFGWRVAAFHRRSRNTVDWVKHVPGGPWQATDLGTVRTHGVEGTVAAALRPTVHVTAGYMYLHKNSDRDAWASRYVLDYARHGARARVAWRPLDWLTLGVVQELRFHTDNPARDSGSRAMPASIDVTVRPPRWQGASLAVGCDNVWNDDFQVYPGQRAAGRRVWCSLRWAW